MYRYDRVLREGGGVALIARSDFIVRPLCLSSKTMFDARCDISSKFAVFSVLAHFCPTFVIYITYRPPQTLHFSYLLDNIRGSLACCPKTIIVGEFNYNLLDPESDNHYLVLCLSELDFSVIRFGSIFFHNSGESELAFGAFSGFSLV